MRQYLRHSMTGYILLAVVTTSVRGEPGAADVQRGYLLSPKAFRAAAAKVLPSLVTIESIGGIAISPGAKVGKRTRSSGISKPGEGPTTGLIVSKEGHIVTSTFNFLKKPPIITVTLNDGSQYVAKMLGRDDTRELCLLKIEADRPLPTPELVDRNELRVGQWAISLGVGYGDSNPAISAGIISATHRISGRAVQTDANISPANYGGPLIDISGRVIGICSPLSPSRGGARR
ncbi:MAG: S1C family serine protease, partial [Pirellulales bacterium]|nr:S1C family serine protease [Pirellulales bacterium]